MKGKTHKNAALSTELYPCNQPIIINSATKHPCKNHSLNSLFSDSSNFHTYTQDTPCFSQAYFSLFELKNLKNQQIKLERNPLEWNIALAVRTAKCCLCNSMKLPKLNRVSIGTRVKLVLSWTPCWMNGHVNRNCPGHPSLEISLSSQNIAINLLSYNHLLYMRSIWRGMCWLGRSSWAIVAKTSWGTSQSWAIREK